MMMFFIDDTEDVKNRINKASKSIGMLKFTWNSKDIPIDTKIKLHETMLLNSLL